jgi:hypothetical protein
MHLDLTTSTEACVTHSHVNTKDVCAEPRLSGLVCTTGASADPGSALSGSAQAPVDMSTVPVIYVYNVYCTCYVPVLLQASLLSSV